LAEALEAGIEEFIGHCRARKDSAGRQRIVGKDVYRSGRHMTKKYKLILIFIIIFLFFFIPAGVIICKNIIRTDKSNPGLWGLARTEKNEKDNEEYKKLMSLGYLQGYDQAPDFKNVTIFNKNKAFNGYNFYISGHAPEAILMDMQGKILHKWSYKIATDIWPNTQQDNDKAFFWRRAHLFENGDVLALYQDHGLIKIDKDSNLLWSYASDKKPHHDFEVTRDGKIYLLTQQKKHIHGIPEHLTALEDFITILTNEGVVLKHISIFELLEKSSYSGLINYKDIIESAKGWGELFHTNTIEVFDGELEGKSPLFKKGNVMISVLWMDTIFIIDMEAEKMIWALGSGMWKKQHQPTLLTNGNILIFNNLFTNNSSRIMEFEPCTQQIVWDYKGDAKNKFFSRTCGSNQRLSNGNTLITETDTGRAFEVTRAREIVWEFFNPFRAGKKNELIATIPEMIRVSSDDCTFLTNSPSK
jgi:hypothetical protein